MKIIDQIKHTYGKRVALDTPLRITTYDTEALDTPSGIGQWCTFDLTVEATTVVQEGDTDAFHKARKAAAQYIIRELYGDIADRLVEISFKDYETSRGASSEVRQMLDRLIGELRGQI